MFEIKKQIIKYNNPGTIINPKGIVLHETATPGASAQREYKYFNEARRKASAHAFIDTKEIIQCIEWKNKAFHAGTTANNNFIGIEMCNVATQSEFNIIYGQTVELFAYLFINELKIFKITPDNLPSHAEISNKYHESDHQDPLSYFKKFGKTVDGFRKDVQAQIDKLMAVNLTYKEVLTKFTSNPTDWENAIQFTVKAVKSNSALGILNIFEYFPVLLEKINKARDGSVLSCNDILKKVTSKPDKWEEAIDFAVEIARDDSDLGILEIFKFTMILIEKIHNSK
jgi:N-acetylmuramoyl-L-alanine amidase CwlA